MSPVEAITETIIYNSAATNNDKDGDNEITDAPSEPSTETIILALIEDVTITWISVLYSLFYNSRNYIRRSILVFLGLEMPGV